MKRDLRKLVIFFILSLGILRDASGDVLVSQQPPRFDSAAAVFSNLGSPESEQQIADDFRLNATAVITNAAWWGNYGSNRAPADPIEFTLRFFLDAAQRPGVFVAETKVYATAISNALVAVDPVWGNVILYSFSGAFSPPVLLSTGVTYWVSILETDPATTSGFRWSEADFTTPISRAYRFNAEEGWRLLRNGWPQAYLLEGTTVQGSPPVAVANVVNEVRVPSIIDEPGQFVVIAPNGIEANVVFDASASWDPDGDLLRFSWSHQLSPLGIPFASEVRTTNVFGAGRGLKSTPLRLSATDGVFSTNDVFDLVVVSPAMVVVWLIDVLEEDASPGVAKRSLLNPLGRALAGFEEENNEEAVRALNQFLVKARHQQVSPTEVRAAGVRRLAQILIDAVTGE